jgi:SAM-dependent methyltransferase
LLDSSTPDLSRDEFSTSAAARARTPCSSLAEGSTSPASTRRAVAIDRAQAKARTRGLSVRFIQGDALRLAALAETFDTVSDSGLLHVFSDQDMERLIRSVHAVLRPSGLYWLMCFSEHATFPGPRRLTQQHIATLFKEGWQIRSIEHARFEVIAGRGEDEGKIAAAWLAGIERL